LSTLDDFQRRITKLEKEVAELKAILDALVKAKETLTLPEASDYAEPMPEERIAEEAVEEAHVEE